MSARTPPARRLSEGPHRGEEITLLVDVGTNAEIVLGNKDRLVAASSPTGPAFEGAEISGGQRAAPGAIERVRIDPVTLEPKVKVIGGDHWSDEPEFAETAATVGVTGICGSGIIEAIGEMFLAGIISEDGVIDGALAAKSDRIVADRPHLRLRALPRRSRARHAGDPHPADRRARHPACQGGALRRRAASDGQARHREGRPHQARRRVRHLHRSEIRDGDRAHPRLPARQGGRASAMPPAPARGWRF